MTTLETRVARPQMRPRNSRRMDDYAIAVTRCAEAGEEALDWQPPQP
jgi:hypothetical protein